MHINTYIYRERETDTDLRVVFRLVFSGIKFPDGNKWTKVPGGTPERRPKKATLTSETEVFKAQAPAAAE